MSMNNSIENIDHCLNCQEPLVGKGVYCANCGQKNTDGRISLKDFLHNFLDNVFNLDSRIFRTVSQLFLPGKLTVEYFKGRHKSYYHPIRLYLVMSLIFFAILSSKEGSMVNFNISSSTKDVFEEAEKEKYFRLYKSNIDSLSQIILTNNSHPKAQDAMDSLYQLLPKPVLQDSMDFTLNSLDDSEFKVAEIDALTMDADELMEKYKIDGFVNQLMVKQGLRTLRDEGMLSRQLASNLPIMLLIMMPFLALFLKLVYVRQQRYFVEHLVFSFHHHALVFFLFAILSLFPEDYYSTIMPLGAMTVLVFLFLAMKRVYQQGNFKTFLKFCIFNLSYLFLFLFALLTTLIISFLLF